MRGGDGALRMIAKRQGLCTGCRAGLRTEAEDMENGKHAVTKQM